MRERISGMMSALAGLPYVSQAWRAFQRFMRFPWARYALVGVGGALILTIALSAFHANGANLPLIPNTLGGQKVADTGYGQLVSRGKPVFCSPSDFNEGGPDAITSGKYGDYSFWRADLKALPSWCAVHVGAGPKRLLVVWASDYIFDYIAPDGMTPRDYTLAVSADSSDGDNGHWQTVVTVTGNETRVREAVIPFTGMSWVKMTVTAGQAKPSQPFVTIDQIDCYDVTSGLNDTAVFAGDSITVMAYNRFDGSHPTFDELMHQADPKIFPVMLDEGYGGWSSGGAVSQMPEWLALNPDIHYWLLQWGTNDAFGMLDPAVYRDNMQRLIDLIKLAGHVPVLAHIPAVNIPGDRGTAMNAEIRALNAQIDALTQANHLITGPDMYALFSKHAGAYLLTDGVHPTPAGAAAMNFAWYQVMRPVFTGNAS